MITSRQIEAFRAVVLSRSFTGAAEMLNVTQPAVSRLFRDLETELGLELATRQQGGLRLTEEAHALFSEVERSYVGMRKIELAAKRIAQHKRGTLRVCANAAFSLHLLPIVVRKFSEAHEGIAVSLRICDTDQAVDLVRSRQFDIAYVMTPADTDGVHAGPVLHSRCVCILPASHELATRDMISVQDLSGEPFVSLDETSMTRMKIDAGFEAANVARHMEIQAEGSASVCNLVAHGLGVSIMSTSKGVMSNLEAKKQGVGGEVLCEVW